MTDIVHESSRDHDWLDYDEHHKACRRCGLRLFFTAKGTNYGQVGWVLVTHGGVTAPNLLGSGAGKWGRCDPPPKPPVAETVLIDYTGDPDIHPGCERYMHRLPPAAAALLDLKALTPVCGYRAEWWELGPARDHAGWTWCLDCWGRGKRRPVELPNQPAPTLNARGPTLSEWKAAQRRPKLPPPPRDGRKWCYCPKCAGGLPPLAETIREIRLIRRKSGKGGF